MKHRGLQELREPLGTITKSFPSDYSSPRVPIDEFWHPST